MNESDLQGFLDAGYSKQQALEVNLIIALKTISNYTSHLADTPLDDVYLSGKSLSLRQSDFSLFQFERTNILC